MLNFCNFKRCSTIKGILRNFTKFTGKIQCQSLFFNKVASLRLTTLLKKRLWQRCFPVNFVKIPRTPFLQNTSGQLRLKLSMWVAETCFEFPRKSSIIDVWLDSKYVSEVRTDMKLLKISLKNPIFSLGCT